MDLVSSLKPQLLRDLVPTYDRRANGAVTSHTCPVLVESIEEENQRSTQAAHRPVPKLAEI